MSNLSRRSIIATAAALPALAVPAVAVASAGPDPIFDAIEAHRRVHAEWLSCVGRECDLEVEHGFGDPRNVSAERAALAANDKMDEASADLVDVEPTSLAGAIALLAYFAENDVKDGGDGTAFPETLSDDDDPAINKNCGGAPYSYFIAQNVKRALSRLAVQS